MTDSAQVMWEQYLASGLPHSTEAAASGYTAWSFGDGPPLADELAELVLHGSKRATTGSLWAYEREGERLPEVGDFSVVTDGSGLARCIIRSTDVQVVAFSAVDEEFARAEGEGDLSLRYWREGHWHYFSKELEGLGLRPDPDMPVVCERFEVVYPVPDPPRMQGPMRPTTRS